MQELARANVMNGKVKAGDRVTYAVRQGSQTYTLIGSVRRIEARPIHAYTDETQAVLCVTVTEASWPAKLPYDAIVRRLDRVVKLAEPGQGL